MMAKNEDWPLFILVGWIIGLFSTACVIHLAGLELCRLQKAVPGITVTSTPTPGERRYIFLDSAYEASKDTSLFAALRDSLEWAIRADIRRQILQASPGGQPDPLPAP